MKEEIRYIALSYTSGEVMCMRATEEEIQIWISAKIYPEKYYCRPIFVIIKSVDEL